MRKQQTDSDITREEIEEVIEKYIVLHLNAERNRSILKRRMIDGLSHEQLAEEFDLSVQSIQKILYKYEPIIFKHLSI
jgi:DNA-directed RNA polymerase specialized sigma24 family protein